ncbi:S9 family peptidase [Ferroacidibacillus organovorans]|uniref:Oligopeptidase B n=1 Tax=Ferroacidibacillus organovorans TaxID=1765683 RepID=A0A1V4EPW0_9BACL|nr:S9 family peptidase [Ferroacidibacillus organovorans]OPG14975.1 oligopeptidase B [Ferroacidibacillus organovorans]
MQSPMAKRIPHVHTLHDDQRVDDYYWLREKTNSEVLEYLEEENRYYDEKMKPLQSLKDRIFEAMKARVPEVEMQVPVQNGNYFYYARQEKALQYPIYARKCAKNRDELRDAREEIVLDLNELARAGGYLSVTVQRISPDQQKLAYLENRDGTDQYTAYVKDLATGELLSDQIPNVFIAGSLEWDGTGRYLFYVTVDETQRPYRLYRHELGSTQEDELIYEERDTAFTIDVYKARSGKFLFLQCSTKATSEVHFLEADRPRESFQCFEARRDGILYELEHWRDDFLLLTNENAANFTVFTCPIRGDDPARKKELVPYDAARYLQALHPFADHLLLEGRAGGSTQIWRYEDRRLEPLTWDESVYTVNVGRNPEYRASEVLIEYQSFLTPRTTIALRLSDGQKTVLQESPVAGEYVRDAYRQERRFAIAEDGTRVPYLLVYHRDAMTKGPAPLLLYAYGSYGINMDAHFDPQHIPLLDAGLVMAIAQIRGGSEMGRTWYEDGKLFRKRNTFTDYIAVAKDLLARNDTSKKLLAARGGSAGGLLMGAVANLAPELFQVVIADVPFVDVVTTMLDTSIPLTSLEWDEWGNPQDAAYYAYMKSYSPYDQVEAKAYPNMLVTTGLNDPRVGYFEPAKWVARLRATKTDDHTLLLKTHMGAGHFGSSGRFSHMEEMAERYAFLFHHLGLSFA